MYLDLDAKAMIKLYEWDLGNITDTMIFSELTNSNYDPLQVFEVAISDKFTRRLDYNVEDEYYAFRKLLDTVRIRRKVIRRDLFSIKKLVNNLEYLKINNEELFNLYYILMQMSKKFVKEYNYDSRGDAIDYILKPVEDFLKTDKVNMIEAGMSITTFMKEFSSSPELAMSLLYSLTGMDYYASELIRYIEDKNAKLTDNDNFNQELSKLINSNILSCRIDGFIELMNSIDELIEIYDPECKEKLMLRGIESYTLRSYNHLSKLRDGVTRFIIEKNL